MMGFYPDCPGEPFYTLTTPVFDKVEIALPNGKIEIGCHRPSPESIYIKEVTIGGKRIDSYRIGHKELTSGKRIVFTLKERNDE